MNRLKNDLARTGFTVLELLIVIGVLAGLAAVLFPVFMSVREKGRQAVCSSNERQIGAAVLLYVQDSDGIMPPTTVNSVLNVSGPVTFWPQLIFPYVHSDDCFICPDSNSSNDTLYWLDANHNRVSGYRLGGRPGPPRVSYIYNLKIGGILWPSTNNVQIAQSHEVFAPKTLGQILRPAATVLLTDGATDPVNNVPETWPEAGSEAGKDFLDLGDAARVQGGPDVIGAAPNARHQGQANVLFADSHVKSLRLETFYVFAGKQGDGETEFGLSPCLDPAMGCPMPQP